MALADQRARPVLHGRGGDEVAGRTKARRSDMGGVAASVRGASAPSLPIISTFTSAQEREALRRALAKGRSVIKVVPQGLPFERELSSELREALADEGDWQALVGLSTATITMVGGAPVVEWLPKLSAADGSRRCYTSYGRERAARWSAPTSRDLVFVTVDAHITKML